MFSNSALRHERSFWQERTKLQPELKKSRRIERIFENFSHTYFFIREIKMC